MANKFLISVDLGYGDIKGCNTLGNKFIFPALISQGRNRDLEKIFNKNKNSLIDNLYIKLSDNELNTEEFFVGNLAKTRTLNNYFAIQDNKINSIQNKVELATMASLLIPKHIAENTEIQLVTGLPVDHFVKQKNEFKEMLSNFKYKIQFPDTGYERNISFSDVKLFPQSAGAIYKIIHENPNRFLIKETYIAMIDVGFKTTDIVVFHVDSNFMLSFVKDMSVTIDNVGISKIYTGMNDTFSRYSKNGEKLDINRLMLLSREGKIFYNSKERDFTKNLKDLRKSVAQSIINQIDTIWDTSRINSFNSIMICGGGGEVLYPYLKEIKPEIVTLIENPQLANCLGYLKFAQDLISKGK